MDCLTKKQRKEINDLLVHLLKQTKSKKIKWNIAYDDEFRTNFNNINIELTRDLCYSKGDFIFINTKRVVMSIDTEKVFDEKWNLFPSGVARKILKICKIKKSRVKDINDSIDVKRIQKQINKAKEVYLIEKLSGLE